MAEPIERYTLTVEEKVTKPEQAKSVTPSETAQTVLPDEGYALNRVNVGAIPPEYIVPTGKKTVTENETGIDITSYAELDVAVPIPPTPTYQTKSVTPTKQAQQIVPDTGFDALSEVDFAAIPSEYIVPTGSQNITENGNDIDIADKATVNVLVQPSLQDKTVTPTKQSQSVQADNNYYGLDTVTVNPIPNEYIVPTGTKSIVQNGTGIDVTDYAEVDVAVPAPTPSLQSKTATPTTSQQSITPDSGYDGLSGVTVNAIPSEYVIPTGTKQITQNGTGIDVSQYASADVVVPSGPVQDMTAHNGTFGGVDVSLKFDSTWEVYDAFTLPTATANPTGESGEWTLRNPSGKVPTDIIIYGDGITYNSDVDANAIMGLANRGNITTDNINNRFVVAGSAGGYLFGGSNARCLLTSATADAIKIRILNWKWLAGDYKVAIR